MADLERDLAVATVRSFVQLILIGYALELISNQDNRFFTVAILGLMITITGFTSGARLKQLPAARWIAVISITVGTIVALGLLLLLGVFKFIPQATRLYDDVRDQRLVIEPQLVLGATGRQASLNQFRRAVRGAMIPIVDSTKLVGLITLPGAMPGMILAGASPLQAVRQQIIVM